MTKPEFTSQPSRPSPQEGVVTPQSLPNFESTAGFAQVFQDPFSGTDRKLGTGDQRRNSYSDGFSDAPSSSQSEAGFDDAGFFSGVQENFPDLSDFGLSWEPKKIRSKRSAPSPLASEYPIPATAPRSAVRTARARLPRGRSPRKNPFYYRDERQNRRKRVQHQPVQQSSNRRSQGPTGFWDDSDFDSDFFNGGGPSTFSYEDFTQKVQILISCFQSYRNQNHK